MPYLRDRVFILKKEPFREHDRRMVMYGREHGLLFAVARGSSSKSSKQSGYLEPFMEAEVMVAKGAAIDKLAVASHIGTAQPRVNGILSGLTIMGACCELVASLTRPGIHDTSIYDLLVEVRDLLSNLQTDLTPDRARLLLAGCTLKLLDATGFAPTLDDSTRLPAAGLTLVRFMRRFSLADLLRVTAPADVLRAASSFVEDAVKHTPLDRPPHGPATLAALLA